MSIFGKNNEPIKTIKYKELINESAIFLNDDHENEVAKRLDEITLSRPVLLIRKNPETWFEESLPVTEKILNFLKENKEEHGDSFSYDLFIDYSFGQVNDIPEMEDNEEGYYATPISEDEFMESEKKYWEYEPTEEEEQIADGIMNAVKAFHNMKWHDGEEYWKYSKKDITT